MQLSRLRYSEILKASLPVIIGYSALGFTFGVLFQQKGGTAIESLFISLFTFAGAAQFLAIDFYNSNADMLTFFIAIFLLNIRHMIYGLTSLNKLGKWNAKKVYLIHALTDENFGMLNFFSKRNLKQKDLVKLFFTNQLFWMMGCTAGVLLASSLNMKIKGMDFILTALFLILIVENIKGLMNDNRR